MPSVGVLGRQEAPPHLWAGRPRKCQAGAARLQGTAALGAACWFAGWVASEPRQDSTPSAQSCFLSLCFRVADPEASRPHIWLGDCFQKAQSAAFAGTGVSVCVCVHLCVHV